MMARISALPLSDRGSVCHDGGQIEVEYTNETMYVTAPDTYLEGDDWPECLEPLLWNDLVDEFFMEFSGYTPAKAQRDCGLNFMVPFAFPSEVPAVIKTFKHMMGHLMDCVTYHSCPLCSYANISCAHPETGMLWKESHCGCIGETTSPGDTWEP